MSTGIEPRHGKDCPARDGGRCNRKGCGYRASVWDARANRRVRKTFPTEAAAKTWRSDMQGQVRRRRLTNGTTDTVKAYWSTWIADAESGKALNRSGERYKSRALDGYTQTMEAYILPVLGAQKMSDLDRATLQRLVSQLQADKSPSTVRNAIVPLRAIYRHAGSHGDVDHNPTTGLALPANRGQRAVAEIGPSEAITLLEELPEPYDRALWSTAIYGGLRLGELQGLRWSDLDLPGELHVRQSWDFKSKAFVTPKSAKGVRTVPVATPLRLALEDHAEAGTTGLVFGRANGDPFSHNGQRDRAHRIWKTAELEPLGFHEARHVAASLWIAAGVNIKVISDLLGHSGIAITMDRYGHLLPGSRTEAAALMDRLLMGQSTGQSDADSNGSERNSQPQKVAV